MDGSRRRSPATIYAVAERAGVSIATVSRTIKSPAVVAEVTRRRVLDAIASLDYRPDSAARSLAARRHQAHGLILPELTGVYYADLLAGYESVAGALGQSVVLVVAKDGEDLGERARSLATRVDGIAVMGAAPMVRAALRDLAAALPVAILAGAPVEGAELIVTENVAQAQALTGRLLDAGRRRLTFVGDPDVAVDVAHRYEGFVAAHSARGLTAAPPLRVEFHEEAGREVAARQASALRRPDGLVCANDMLAIAALDHLIGRGVQVPGDIAVTGWDDILVARYLRPRLSTVRQPVRAMAALAARRLQERIDGDPVWGTTHIIPTDIVVRESCGTAGSVPTRE